MKAIVLRSFGSTANFMEVDLPVPAMLAGEVLVKVEAVAFNPVDCQIRRGQPESSRARSMILGRDLSGIVEAVHASVTGFSAGDEVFGYVCNLASSGTYAEYVSVPAELLAFKPRSLTHEQSAAVPVAGITASLALRKARAGNTRRMFIAGGAGGVGSFAIALARHLGVQHLVATAGSAASRAHLVDRCGLKDEQVLDYRDAGFARQAMDRSGDGFGFALDLVGGTMLSACCSLLAVDGDLASVTEAPSRDDFEVLFERNASFHPVGAHAYSLLGDRAAWLHYRGMLQDLARRFDDGSLAPPFITVVGAMSAHAVRQAHDLLDGNRVQGKLVMRA